MLYVIDSLAVGGAERQFVELVKGIDKRHIVSPHVCLFSKKAAVFLSELEGIGVPVTLLERKAKFDFSLIVRLVNLIKTQSITIVHSFSATAGLVAVIAGKMAKVPVVASTIRNATNPDLQTNLSIRFQALLADSFVSNSRAGLINRFKKHKSTFRIVYNGVDIKRFEINKDEIKKVRDVYQLDRFSHIVSMVASISINKDYGTYIKAMPLILCDMPDTGFLIVGDGSERDRIEQRVRALKLCDNVVFTGYTSNVCEILANTDVSILMTNTKRHQEGVSNALLESMGLGVSVVASIGGGTNEIVEHEVNGFLVAPFDAKSLASSVLELLANAKMRKKMGARGKEVLKKCFGYNRYLNEYLSIYQELLPYKLSSRSLS